VDWLWLGKKFEKIISCWSHRWLTLGGRFILLKEVLESTSVYWISLEKISKSILNSIRRRMFNFLWYGKKEKEGMPLINWKKIAKPKKGWWMGYQKYFYLWTRFGGKKIMEMSYVAWYLA